MFLSTRGRLQEGKVLAPFLSVVFHGLLETCSFLNCLCVLKSFLFNFVITLVSILKSVTKLFLKIVLKVFVKKHWFLSKYLKVSTYSKKDIHFSRFLQTTLSYYKEQVALSLDVKGLSKGTFTVTKATGQDLLVIILKL